MAKQDYDACYECTGYGDDYFLNDNGEWESRCPHCHYNDLEFEGEDDYP